MLFRLTNGLTPITLSSSGPSLGVTYVPAASRQPRVAETVRLVLEGTAAAIRSTINQVELMFAAARWENEKVYLEYRPEDSGDILRSRIYEGYILWSPDPIKRVLSSTSGLVEVELLLERDNFFEGPEEELYMSSATMSERIGGVTISMTANQNWMQIADTRVKGTDKAPVRIKITNTSGTDLAWRNFYWGVNAFSLPTAADLWLLASESSTGDGVRTWAANTGTNHELLTWLFPLSNTLLAQTLGRSFKVIATFNNGVNLVSTFVRASIGVWMDGFYLANVIGQERSFYHEVTDLGELPFPPGGVGIANANSALAITVRATTSGGGATLNYIMLMPTDSSRHWYQMGFNASAGEIIEDNGLDGGIFAQDSAGKYSIIQAARAPLKIFPNRTQRMYCLFSEDGGFTPARTLTVQAWYRPVYDNF